MDEQSLSINAATATFIEENLDANTDDLFLRKTPEGVDLKLAIRQIKGRKKIVKKIPTWYNHLTLKTGFLFPESLALEQCSSEQTATFKASIIKGNKLLDMTGGFGVDTYFLAKNFDAVDYVESNADLFRIVQHNLKLLGKTNIQFHHTDSVDFLQQKNGKYDWVYIDPYRRDASQKRVFFIEDCTPDLVKIQDLLLEKSEQVLVKFSPMLDLEILIKSLKNITRIFIVSVKNECKELLVVLSKKETDIVIEAVDIYPEQTISFQALFSDRKVASVDYAMPSDYLYEPNKAILKAGIQDKLAERFDLKKLERHSHFYTSQQLYTDFPGRIFKVKNILKPKMLNKYLPDKKANVIARNFPMKASVIYQKYKITPGGHFYIIATTLEKQEKVFILAERESSKK